MSMEIPCVAGIHSLTISLYLDSQVSSLKNETEIVFLVNHNEYNFSLMSCLSASTRKLPYPSH